MELKERMQSKEYSEAERKGINILLQSRRKKPFRKHFIKNTEMKSKAWLAKI